MDEQERPGQEDPDLVQFCLVQHRRLVGLLSLYLGDRSTAEDLAQDTLVRVCRDWKKVRTMEAPEAWTRKVALNLANSWLRRLRLRGRHTSMTDRGSTPDPADVIAVRRAVASLPRRQRSAVVLRYFEDLPVPEVAVAMKCAEGTVRALTSQGLTSLRSLLADASEVQGGS